MSYRYEDQKPWLFTDEGQRALLAQRDWCQKALATAGSFTSGRGMAAISTPDTWKAMALFDRLVELGEIRELTGPEAWGQHRVFVKAGGW
jgi:hypothetical protein